MKKTATLLDDGRIQFDPKAIGFNNPKTLKIICDGVEVEVEVKNEADSFPLIEKRGTEYFFKGRGTNPVEMVRAMFAAGETAEQWESLMQLEAGSMEQAILFAKNHPEEVDKCIERLKADLDEAI